MRNTTRKNWKLHSIFTCQDCNKEWLDYTTAEKLAFRHAKKTGHHIRGENGYCVVFNEPE